jgi:hypothetical protein
LCENNKQKEKGEGSALPIAFAPPPSWRAISSGRRPKQEQQAYRRTPGVRLPILLPQTLTLGQRGQNPVLLRESGYYQYIRSTIKVNPNSELICSSI